MYSGSKSDDGSCPFCMMTPFSSSFFMLRGLSKASKPITAEIPSSSDTTVTEPSGSSALYPSLGSPSSAVRTYSPSGENVTISGWMPAVKISQGSIMPFSRIENNAMRPALLYDAS